MEISGNMNLNEAYKLGIEKLKASDIEAPAREAGAFLCNILEIDFSAIFTHSEIILEESKEQQFIEMLEKRCNKMPFQYIIGSQEFMSLHFKVNKNTLIPRADTEILVETILKKEEYFDTTTPISILDIGTGSGCIAISLAHYLKNAYITAIDISNEAINVASENAQINKVSKLIHFVQLDILSDFPLDTLNLPFDMIVSNPPYIPAKDIKTLQPEVALHEPINALDGGSDGLDFYRMITQKSNKLLKPKGILAFEVGINQSHDVRNIMSKIYSDIKIIPDLAGIPRVVVGYLK